jgi:hypothetical protein
MLRRVVTTTVNFFVLDTLPLPNVSDSSPIGKELVDLARRISAAEGAPEFDGWLIGAWRARIDSLVALAWGISTEEMELILQDFPLLDRKQPAIHAEERSTVTSDSVIAELSDSLGIVHPSKIRRQEAKREGAFPYVPAEFAKEYLR